MCNRHGAWCIANVEYANAPNTNVMSVCSYCTRFSALCISAESYLHLQQHTPMPNILIFILFLYEQLLYLYRTLEYQPQLICMCIILQHVFSCTHMPTMKIIDIAFIEHICLYRCTLFAMCLFMYIDIPNKRYSCTEKCVLRKLGGEVKLNIPMVLNASLKSIIYTPW